MSNLFGMISEEKITEIVASMKDSKAKNDTDKKNTSKKQQPKTKESR